MSVFRRYWPKVPPVTASTWWETQAMNRLERMIAYETRGLTAMTIAGVFLAVATVALFVVLVLA